jgi:hypothetical protein
VLVIDTRIKHLATVILFRFLRASDRFQTQESIMLNARVLGFLFTVSLLFVGCNSQEETALPLQPPTQEKPAPTDPTIGPNPAPIDPNPTPTDPAPNPGHPGHGAGSPHINDALIPAPTQTSFSTERIASTNEVATQSSGGAFRISCKYSHMSYDDPIVYPGQPGRAHLHTFFGNTGTNADSTYESLRQTGNSTCSGGIMNRSAYWVPSMIETRTGRPLAPVDAIWYYKSANVDLADTRLQLSNIPNGLRMIAGDARASTPQTIASNGGQLGSFSCYNSDRTEQYAGGQSIPNCPSGDYVAFNLQFPQCWDGENLDSADHKSHMAYFGIPGQGWICPSTHPVILPELSLNIYWRVEGDSTDSSTWRLSSDAYSDTLPGGYSIHADFFEGWNPSVKNAWTENCIQGRRDCHAHLLGDGRMFY